MIIIRSKIKCPRCDVIALKQYGTITCVVCGWQGPEMGLGLKYLKTFPKKQCVYCQRLFTPKSPIQYVCGDYSCVRKRKMEVATRLKLVGHG